MIRKGISLLLISVVISIGATDLAHFQNNTDSSLLELNVNKASNGSAYPNLQIVNETLPSLVQESILSPSSQIATDEGAQTGENINSTSDNVTTVTTTTTTTINIGSKNESTTTTVTTPRISIVAPPIGNAIPKTITTATTANIPAGLTTTPSTTTNASTLIKHKCPLSTLLYEEFNSENLSGGMTSCNVISETYLNTETRLGQLEYNSCLTNKCKFYSAKLRHFGNESEFPDKLKKVVTLAVSPERFCEDEEDASNSLTFNAFWPKLTWLQLELQNPNECYPIYQLLSSWTMPKLKLLTLTRPYFSLSNQESIRNVLRRNGGALAGLRINQGLLCIHCNIFRGLQLPKLKVAHLQWKQSSAHVVQQLHELVAAAPNLSSVTFSVDVTIPNLILMSQRMKKLKNGKFGVLLSNGSDSARVNAVSLQHLTIGFQKIEHLTLRISCDGLNEGASVHVNDFEYLPPSLQSLTLMTKGSCGFTFDSKSRKACSKQYQLLQKGQFLKCVK